MSDKATARPWKRDDYYETIEGSKVPVISGDDGFEVCVLAERNVEIEGANANLIVRAVNTHDAMVALARHILSLEGETGTALHEMVDRRIQEARQCLELAEEES